jgi:hypothetical protein
MNIEVNSDPAGTPPPGGPSYRPIVITLLCAFILAGGSCFGFLATFKTLEGTNPPMNTVFIGAFFCCVIVFVGALLWLLVTWLHRRAK